MTDEAQLPAEDAGAIAQESIRQMKKPAQLLAVVDGVTVDVALLPTQPHLHMFSGAFRLEEHRRVQKIGIDMDKAREIAKQEIRQARVEHFAKNDGATAIATRRGDSKALAELNVKADQLADATKDKRIAAAKNGDELFDAVEAIIAEF